MKFNLQLDEAQVHLVLKGLQELPAKESMQAIQFIGGECQRQAQAAQEQKTRSKPAPKGKTKVKPKTEAK
jgi:hypothetical protein